MHTYVVLFVKYLIILPTFIDNIQTSIFNPFSGFFLSKQSNGVVAKMKNIQLIFRMSIHFITPSVPYTCYHSVFRNHDNDRHLQLKLFSSFVNL